MSVIKKLATSLGRRDEVPNQLLAQQIVRSKNKDAIEELIENLSNKDKNIQTDCIKVLYEVGESEPGMIAGHDKVFIELLSHKNNRMIWGAMHAIDCIASVNPKGIYKNLTLLLDAADNGSVITRDHVVNILIKLSKEKSFSEKALILLLDQMKSCPTNQLPMYAENSISVIPEKYKKDFIKVLSKRIPEIEKDSKKKRVEKVIKKLGQEKKK